MHDTVECPYCEHDNDMIIKVNHNSKRIGDIDVQVINRGYKPHKINSLLAEGLRFDRISLAKR